MKVKYTGENYPQELIAGKIYEVLSVEGSCYRIIDETGEGCLYPPEAFEIVNSTQTISRMVCCHDCGKRLSGAGFTVTSTNGNRRQVTAPGSIRINQIIFSHCVLVQ